MFKRLCEYRMSYICVYYLFSVTLAEAFRQVYSLGMGQNPSEHHIIRNDEGVEDKMAKKAMLKNDFYRSVPRCGVERRIEKEREEEG